MLHAGESAPAFTLPDADMEMFDMASLRGKQHAVLYFYPKDDTPGCTLEAIEFTDHDEAFARCGCVVLGVSRDDCIRHAEFRDKHGLSVRLLADTEGEVSAQYGVWQEKSMYGKKYMGIVRSHYVIDEQGRIADIQLKVKPEESVTAALAALG